MTGRDSTIRLPSWLIAASLAVVVIATLTYFITTNNDNTDEATPPPETSSPSSSEPSDQASKSADDGGEKSKSDDKSGAKSEKDTDKPAKKKDIGGTKKSDAPPKSKHKQAKKPKITPDATVDVYNNAGITNLAASASANVRAAGFAIGGVDNWYGAIPSTTVYYPPGLEQQAELLADTLGVGRIMPAVDPMSSERLSLILTAAI